MPPKNAPKHRCVFQTLGGSGSEDCAVRTQRLTACAWAKLTDEYKRAHPWLKKEHWLCSRHFTAATVNIPRAKALAATCENPALLEKRKRKALEEIDSNVPARPVKKLTSVKTVDKPDIIENSIEAYLESLGITEVSFRFTRHRLIVDIPRSAISDETICAPLPEILIPCASEGDHIRELGVMDNPILKLQTEIDDLKEQLATVRTHDCKCQR